VFTHKVLRQLPKGGKIEEDQQVELCLIVVYSCGVVCYTKPPSVRCVFVSPLDNLGASKFVAGADAHLDEGVSFLGVLHGKWQLSAMVNGSTVTLE
jgi:hypothetical protein